MQFQFDNPGYQESFLISRFENGNDEYSCWTYFGVTDNNIAIENNLHKEFENKLINIILDSIDENINKKKVKLFKQFYHRFGEINESKEKSKSRKLLQAFTNNIQFYNHFIMPDNYATFLKSVKILHKYTINKKPTKISKKELNKIYNSITRINKFLEYRKMPNRIKGAYVTFLKTKDYQSAMREKISSDKSIN